jgi:uncharacterized membrane-anchored protein YitT (DUF2179 family)
MSRKERKDYLFITLGTCIIAIAFQIFLAPNDLLVSGTGGIALLIAHFLPISMGIIYLVLNIPLFFIGWKSVGTSFLLKSIWGTLTLSIFLSVVAFLPSFPNVIIGAIAGGILSGIGIGIVIAVGGTTGGTDIISVIMHQKYTWSIGTVMFLINVAIILAGAFLFGWKNALLTVLSLYLTSNTINRFLKRYPPLQEKEHLLK